MKLTEDPNKKAAAQPIEQFIAEALFEMIEAEVKKSYRESGPLLNNWRVCLT